ncbi:CorA metal ion transporter [Basidiobolus ranarum]|uniref:CorA metal ion transporter n=1 Tax=Basidiobolus ranarum TaxID=34480 RepID=A0ABR2WH40_9FUNG
MTGSNRSTSPAELILSHSAPSSPTTPLLGRSLSNNYYGSSGVELRIDICEEQDYDPSTVPAYVAFNIEDGHFDSSSALSHDDVCLPPEITGLGEEGIDFEALKGYLEENVAEDGLISPTLQPSPPTKRTTFKSQAQSIKSQETRYRFMFHSDITGVIYSRSFHEIATDTKDLSELLKEHFWIDVFNPTDNELKVISKIFRIHPLTTEDIQGEETREKFEIFTNYHFICFRTFDQDPNSSTYMEPISIYNVIMKEGILTFHFRLTPHVPNVLRRIRHLKNIIKVTPDWINYAIIDDVTDAFGPLIQNIEFEADSIDELVLILKETEQSDMLRRIGYARKVVMGLLRLLGPKADIIKRLIKRYNEYNISPNPSADIALYLGDIEDHILTMLQSTNHYEKILSRSHANYLAQINIEITQTANRTNDVMAKMTLLASVTVPMNIITGLWGMNVKVPGQDDEDSLGWFYAIVVFMSLLGVFLVWMARKLGLI